MVTNPFETKESRNYFKKKEFFLPSNMIQNQINVMNDLEMMELHNGSKGDTAEEI
jgi:hypothetical protein